MMKKTVAIILALVMVFCFASCKEEKSLLLERLTAIVTKTNLSASAIPLTRVGRL